MGEKFQRKQIRTQIPHFYKSRCTKSSTQFSISLSIEALDESPMHRFLISINPDPEKERKNCPTHHEDEGRLQSLTDVSQHLEYNCFKYLINRQDGGHQIVPFVWRTPQCGCFVINAEILDEKNRIYTHEDDEFYGLTVKVCVVNNYPEVRINKNRRLKKRLKRKEKKHLRRRGKRFCCKKGIKTYLGKMEGSTCQNPDSSILEESAQNFRITEKLCTQVFQACCEDEIVGKELFQNMSKKALRTKQKYQDLRQKMKAKKAKRRQRLKYDY